MSLGHYRVFFLFLILANSHSYSQISKDRAPIYVAVKSAVENNSLSPQWLLALVTRMSQQRLDSFASIKRNLTPEEINWQSLIKSRAVSWNKMLDSLQSIFRGLELNDTITVLLGYLGKDDGFTFGDKIICLDVTALQSAYGNSDLKENENRIDRIFAHEYTHLLHKKWMRSRNYTLKNFRDSVIWECFYEGLGMFRSLNPKWQPVNGRLNETSIEVLDKLTPIFKAFINKLFSKSELTFSEKEEMLQNLSRGRVDQKWGAFPIALWLAVEEQLEPGSIASLIDKGSEAVLILSKKYLGEKFRAKY